MEYTGRVCHSNLCMLVEVCAASQSYSHLDEQASQALESRLRHARTIDAVRLQLSRYAGHLKTLFAGANQPKNR